MFQHSLHCQYQTAMTVDLCQKIIKVRLFFFWQHKFSLRAKHCSNFYHSTENTRNGGKESRSLYKSGLNIALVCSVSTETYEGTERKITDVSGVSPQPLWLESHALLCLSLSSCFLSLAPPLPVPSCTCLALAPIERFTHGELWAWGIVCLLLDINASTPFMTFMLPLQAFASFPNASYDRGCTWKMDVVFPNNIH